MIIAGVLFPAVQGLADSLRPMLPALLGTAAIEDMLAGGRPRRYFCTRVIAGRARAISQITTVPVRLRARKCRELGGGGVLRHTSGDGRASVWWTNCGYS